jgi:hypothetical protein
LVKNFYLKIKSLKHLQKTYKLEIQQLLHPEIQSFIADNLDLNSATLALKKNPFPQVNYASIIHQITAKKKAKDKLPHWFSTDNIIYPEKISLEQTSSESTATYKASLVSGEKLFDCSGGFGIDDYFFSKRFNSVIHCELNTELSAIVQHNFATLNCTNIICHQGDSTEILKKLNQKFDCIYIDPSRRNEAKGKVFLLEDCLPNVVELHDFYFQYTDTLLIKTAPMLDLHAGLLALKNVTEIHIVAVANEVKEVVWKIEKNTKQTPRLFAVNIEKGGTTTTVIDWNQSHQALFSLPKKYLYEPNAALMKSGGFEAISAIFKVEKLHQHSHLYTSETLIDFPGRSFIIDHNVIYQKNEIKHYLEKKKLNISTRNFPLKPDEIKKKHKVIDGGNDFAFFTTNLNNEKIVLLCTKI